MEIRPKFDQFWTNWLSVSSRYWRPPCTSSNFHQNNRIYLILKCCRSSADWKNHSVKIHNNRHSGKKNQFYVQSYGIRFESGCIGTAQTHNRTRATSSKNNSSILLTRKYIVVLFMRDSDRIGHHSRSSRWPEVNSTHHFSAFLCACADVRVCQIHTIKPIEYGRCGTTSTSRVCVDFVHIDIYFIYVFA